MICRIQWPGYKWDTQALKAVYKIVIGTPFPLENLDYSPFQMVMCISLICISNRHELVHTYWRENVQQMTHVTFRKLLHRGFILDGSESV